MKSTIYDTIVIGAGHAGLSISYYLNRFRINHLVFEKGSIGETWRNQRWDSFKFNTPIKVSLLPGFENTLISAEGFWTADEFVSLLEDYVRTFQLPVFEDHEVLSVGRALDPSIFSVTVSHDGAKITYQSRKVVIASGSQNKERRPEFSGKISNDVFQIHSGSYRNPCMLPDGAVLVVGSAQSGVQIAEDLIENGRKVYLSTSRVGRVPRRYRGKDIVDWLLQAGFYDMLTSDVTDPGILKSRFPQISGVGKHGHTISLQSLARKGAVILGKAINAEPSTVIIQPDAAVNIKFADETSAWTKTFVDRYILSSGSDAPAPEEDIDDLPDESGSWASNETSVELKEKGITSIVWATGFVGDFSYMKIPVYDGIGNLKHHEGSTEIEGLYFLGIPWMRKRKSGIILGIKEDAELLARKLMEK